MDSCYGVQRNLKFDNIAIDASLNSITQNGTSANVDVVSCTSGRTLSPGIADTERRGIVVKLITFVNVHCVFFVDGVLPPGILSGISRHLQQSSVTTSISRHTSSSVPYPTSGTKL